MKNPAIVRLIEMEPGRDFLISSKDVSGIYFICYVI